MGLPGADRPRAPAASRESSAAGDLLADSSTTDRQFAAPREGQDQGDAPQPSGSRRRRRIGVLTAGLAVAVAAAAIALASARSPRASSSTGVPPGETTTTVTRRTLTESSTVDGTLGYGSPLEVYDRLSGTYTWLPAVGAVIGRGAALYRLDDLPVALMYGSVPAYRTLKTGVSDGPDVSELNRNLIALAYDPNRAITNQDHFGEPTAAAVRRWQKAEGLSQTGQVELGRIIFAPGARRVTAVHVALGQDPSGATGHDQPDSGQPASKQPASHPRAPKGPASHQSAPKDPGSKEGGSKGGGSKEGGSKEGGSKEGTGSRGGTGSKAGGGSKEGSGSKEGGSEEGGGSKEGGSEEGRGSKSGASNGGGGAGAGGGELVLTTTSTQQIVQLKVKAEQQQLARVGESAPVTLPGGQTAEGRIVEVGTVATGAKENEKGGGGGEKGGSSGGEGGESATISATVALDHPVAHLDQAPVSVELVKSIRHDVLTVPATALTATSGGGYAIDVLEGEHRVALAVTPGMFANGYVQVEGPAVREGLTVIESG
jgi:hypothetical protein